MKMRDRRDQKRPRKIRVRFGVLAGKVLVPPDFDAPLPPDVAHAFADLSGRAADIEPAPRRRPAALVTTDPDVCAGRLCFAGHRLPVEMVLGRLGAGDSLAVLQLDYPWLTDDHLAAAREYVALAEAADIAFDPPQAVIVAKPADLSDG